MWVAISKPAKDGARRLLVIGYEGAIIEMPDETDAWAVGAGEALIVRDPDGGRSLCYDGVQLLEKARRGDGAKIVAFNE